MTANRNDRTPPKEPSPATTSAQYLPSGHDHPVVAYHRERDRARFWLALIATAVLGLVLLLAVLTTTH